MKGRHQSGRHPAPAPFCSPALFRSADDYSCVVICRTKRGVAGNEAGCRWEQSGGGASAEDPRGSARVRRG